MSFQFKSGGLLVIFYFIICFFIGVKYHFARDSYPEYEDTLIYVNLVFSFLVLLWIIQSRNYIQNNGLFWVAIIALFGLSIAPTVALASKANHKGFKEWFLYGSFVSCIIFVILFLYGITNPPYKNIQ
jgi:hypothetical protein